MEEAVATSISLGLLRESEAPSFISNGIHQSSLSNIFREFTQHLYSLGLDSSISLSGNCILVHDHLQACLRHHGVESHMTIGSMHGQGWNYCSTSMDQLLAELTNPDSNREIRVHTWLTLNDASVLDWTGQAWYDTQVNEDHPAESCLVYFPQGAQNETHHYKPFLVGREYLARTGSIRHMLTS